MTKNIVDWYREAGPEEFVNAPACPKTPDGKHVISITGRFCIECNLRGRVPVRRPKGMRVGAVKTRSQLKNPITGTWTKRDDSSGKFMDVKADPKPFKGVRKTRGR